MSLRNSLMPAVASGTAMMARLLVATLAFAGAYAGVGAVLPGPGGPRDAAAGNAPGEAASRATGPVRLTSAAARPAASRARPEPGTVAVTALASGAAGEDSACRRTYQATGLVTADDTGVIYHWRLLRWSDTAGRWRPYLSAPAGFSEETRTVRWRPQIVDNPGRYRVELRAQPGGTQVSEGFQVTC